MERNANAYYELLAATVEAFIERIQYDHLTKMMTTAMRCMRS